VLCNFNVGDAQGRLNKEVELFNSICCSSYMRYFTCYTSGAILVGIMDSCGVDGCGGADDYDYGEQGRKAIWRTAFSIHGDCGRPVAA